MDRQYYARLDSDGYRKGFSLYFEENDELVAVPEAAHILFHTEDEAMAFAADLERDDEQLRYEAETSPIGLEDDAEALASAGMVEGE